jgi:hypothetical protein
VYLDLQKDGFGWLLYWKLFHQGLIWPAVIMILFGGGALYYLIRIMFDKTEKTSRWSFGLIMSTGIIPLLYTSLAHCGWSS